MTAPSWTGENQLIPEVEADFDEVRLLDGILSLKSLTRFSNELARCSIFALDAALRDRMVLDVAAKIDADFIAFRKNKDTQGPYLLQPDPTQDGVFRILGRPVTITNRIPIGTARASCRASSPPTCRRSR
jgi:hypothetical protein